MFGIVWVYNKVMNTPSMNVTPSTILLQPHVGRFHMPQPQIRKKSRFSANSQTSWAIKWGYNSMQVLQ